MVEAVGDQLTQHEGGVLPDVCTEALALEERREQGPGRGVASPRANGQLVDLRPRRLGLLPERPRVRHRPRSSGRLVVEAADGEHPLGHGALGGDEAEADAGLVGLAARGREHADGQAGQVVDLAEVDA